MAAEQINKAFHEAMRYRPVAVKNRFAKLDSEENLACETFTVRKSQDSGALQSGHLPQGPASNQTGDVTCNGTNESNATKMPATRCSKRNLQSHDEKFQGKGMTPEILTLAEFDATSSRDSLTCAEPPKNIDDLFAEIFAGNRSEPAHKIRRD